MRAFPPVPGLARRLNTGSTSGVGTPGSQRFPWSLTNPTVRSIQESMWWGANATATPATLRATDPTATMRATDPTATMRASA